LVFAFNIKTGEKMSKQLENKIEKMSIRIRSQSDELAFMKNDVEKFKKRVSEDMKKIIEIIQSK
tara:strand:+ start:132 stop:323 length:192 start_codon:yes stop_codon:yes gene_type:complete